MRPSAAPSDPQRDRRTFRFCLRAIFQNVSGLAVEDGAYPLQGVEANAFHLSRFEQRNILLGDADALRQRREAAGRKGGTLTISIRPEGCRTADLGERPLHVTTYLRTAETGGYVPLARDLDLRTISPGRDVATEIPPCG